MTLDRLTVLCVGNLLMHDEGLGPRVASELLSLYEVPENVSILDRGVMGMAILSDLRAADKVLVVDALDHTGFAPGTVLSFKPDDMANYSGLKGAHDLRLSDVLAAAALVGIEPEVDCLGVQVKEINSLEAHIGLSPALEAALPAVLAAIENWLEHQGSPIIRS